MICPATAAAVALDAEGRRTSFDGAALQTEIERALLATSPEHAWIAEDIVCAIERAIERHAGNGVFFPESEIAAWAARALEDAGFAAAAAALRRASPGGLAAPQAPPLADPDALRPLLADRLGLAGAALEEAAAFVCGALRAIGAGRCFPALAVELARHHLHATAGPGAGFGPTTKVEAGLGLWLVTPAEVGALDARAAVLRAAGVARLSGVSRLFPSLKVDIDLARLADRAGLDGLVLEMALHMAFGEVAAALNGLVPRVAEAAARAAAASAPAEVGAAAVLPVHTRFPDAALFVAGRMGVAPGDAAILAAALARSLAGHLLFPVRVSVT